MTEPEPTPRDPVRNFKDFVDQQADRLEEALGWIFDHAPHPIRTALEAYDDAHVVGDVPEEED